MGSVKGSSSSSGYDSGSFSVKHSDEGSSSRSRSSSRAKKSRGYDDSDDFVRGSGSDRSHSRTSSTSSSSSTSSEVSSGKTRPRRRRHSASSASSSGQDKACRFGIKDADHSNRRLPKHARKGAQTTNDLREHLDENHGQAAALLWSEGLETGGGYEDARARLNARLAHSGQSGAEFASAASPTGVPWSWVPMDEPHLLHDEDLVSGWEPDQCLDAMTDVFEDMLRTKASLEGDGSDGQLKRTRQARKQLKVRWESFTAAIADKVGSKDSGRLEKKLNDWFEDSDKVQGLDDLLGKYLSDDELKDATQALLSAADEAYDSEHAKFLPGKHVKREEREALKVLAKYDNDWNELKSRGSDEEQQSVYELRLRFMEASMERTVETFASTFGAAVEDIEVGRDYRNGDDILYADDGRRRDYRFPTGSEPPYCTVTFFSPGSCSKTSDLDMQIVVRYETENGHHVSPGTNFSTVSNMFMEEADREFAALWKRARPKHSDKDPPVLMQVFDVNSYPTGFAAVPGQRAEEHFATTFTEEVQPVQDMLDTGLAAMRLMSFDTRDNTDDANQDFFEELARALPKGSDRAQVQHSLALGTMLSLETSIRKAEALAEALGTDDGYGKQLKAMVRATDKRFGNADTMMRNCERLLDEREFDGEPEVWDDLGEMRTLLRDFQTLLDDVASEHGFDRYVVEAEEALYAEMQGDAEDAIQERGAELLSGLKQIENKDYSKKTARRVAKKVDHMSLMAHFKVGRMMAGAREAYTDRASLGYVVEAMQQKRDAPLTAQSAIATTFSNMGFYMQHRVHDAHADLNHGQRMGRIQKYLVRVADSAAYSEHKKREVVVSFETKSGEQLSWTWREVEKLSNALDAIKRSKSSNANKNRAIADELADAGLEDEGHLEMFLQGLMAASLDTGFKSLHHHESLRTLHKRRRASVSAATEEARRRGSHG